MTRSPRGVLLRRFLLFLMVAAVAAAMVLTGCKPRQTVASMPKPSMLVFADTNRLLWLSEKDDTQLAIAEQVWQYIDRGQNLPEPAQEVTRTSIDTVMRTGALAAVYFQKDTFQKRGNPVGVLAIMRPGDAKDVKRGDVLYLYAGPVYRIVAKLDEQNVVGLEGVVYHRMGLD